MVIRLQEYPVYPLYDELSVHNGHTIEQIRWLIDNGTLYRSLPHRAIERLSCEPQPYEPTDSTLQEIFHHADYYYFAEYDPHYRGDDPNPRHVVARNYSDLGTLLRQEQICNITGRMTDFMQPSWHWTHYPAALLSANGELVCYKDGILYMIEKDEKVL